ncbi:MAG: hypothetical protein VKL60_18665 [Sphaerospermopsis sp.]|nr:hypothetical protein [Sphaerospermopsis sp.]
MEPKDTFSKYLELAQKEPCRPFEKGNIVCLLTPQGGVLWVKLEDVSLGSHEMMIATVFIGGKIHLIDVNGSKGLRVVFHPEEALLFGIKQPIYDKAPVRCWDVDVEYRSQITIRFYDALNDCTFSGDGRRDGQFFENYELIQEKDIEAVFGSLERFNQMVSKLEG